MNEFITIVILYHVFILILHSTLFRYVSINNLHILLTGVSFINQQLKKAMVGNKTPPKIR